MLVIGIAGGSGSGKTTLVEHLLQTDCGEDITLLPHDAYYRDAEAMPAELRATRNWDHPEALDNDLYCRHARLLAEGQAVSMPTYDFTTHSRRPHARLLEPRSVLLLEGILLLAIPEIRALMDLRVFVDAPADLRILRRILRDTSERGRSLSSVVDQYQATVKPMHDLFVEASKAHAHLVVPWEVENPAAVQVLLAHIRSAASSGRG